MHNAHRLTLPLIGLVALAAGCGPQAGTLQVSIYGEEYIEEGIPADAFSDGWSVKFSRFLVSVGEVSAARGHDPADLSDGAYRVFDLTRPSGGEGHAVLTAMVPGGAYDHVGYRVAAPPAGTQGGNASAADRDLMIQNSYALYLEATATKEAVEKQLRWGFTGSTRYGECHSEAVVDGGAATAQLTIHADHLFYDDLFSSEPNTSFALVAAADADMNGEVTPAELQALDISTQERYQVGSTGVRDLWSFITYQTGTVGHIDGEGHCEEALRE